jgi:hypothetical protein
MSKGTWYPLVVAVGLLSLSLLLALGLPETLPLADLQVSDDVSDAVSASNASASSESTAQRAKGASWVRNAKNSFAFVAQDRTVASLVCTFFISKIGRQSNNVLFQYVSKKYGWSLSQASIR